MDFDEVYKNLNTAQKEAVDTVDGPLLVIAGPGTGKTQLLSARVANILQKTDSSAENILCLTFTEKAANNMKQRLLDMIGSDAKKVVIKTFHGLGAEIMSSNPDCFWNAAKLDAAPDAIKLEIVSNIISKLPLSNPLALKFSGQYTLVDDILKAIQKAKEAGLTPEKLSALTEANLAYLTSISSALHPLVDERVSKSQIAHYRELTTQLSSQTHDELTAPIPSAAKVLKESLERAVLEAEEAGKPTALSAWKRDWIETVSGQKVLKDIRRNQWWKELAAIYASYQKQMHTNRYFDFADMILEVITQLEQNETLRTDLQERFNYILIDEFQDTNDAQFRLSHLIADNPADEGRPNIMAVGDDDQAIYRFQGAELSNARQFMESYRDTKLIILTENYRSHQTVLDTAEKIAAQIERRLISDFEGLDKNIIAKKDTKPGTIQHNVFPNQTEQYCQLAEKIAKSHTSSGTTVVLARKHSSLEQIASQLNTLGVPIRYERSSNILEHPLVVLISDLANVLEAIHKGQKDKVNSILADVLPHPAWDIKAVTLWKFALSQTNKGSSWLDMLLEHSDEQLQKLGNWLIETAKSARNWPLQVTIEHLLGLRKTEDFCSPIKSYYLTQKLSSDYIFALTALNRLRNLTSEYAKNESVSLGQFVSYLQINRDHHVVLANEAAFVTGENPVELMTVHKAKGLEFETVYLLDVTEKQWQPSRRGRTPPSNLESLQSYGEESDDYARLLFVATTRAERNIYLSSYQFDEQGKEVLPSAFIHDIPATIMPASGAVIEVSESTLRWPELKNEQKQQLLSSLLEEYQLSATGLSDFLDVTSGGPESFINRHILRLPDIRSASLSFGSAIHSALETAQRLTNGDGLEMRAVHDSFESALKKEYLDEGEFTRYKDHGIELLTDLIEGGSLMFNKGDFPERKIEDVRLTNDSINSIKGVLDLVQITPESVHIIDYKTGRELKSLTSTSQADGVRAWKHRLQLTYYLLLARKSGLAKPDQTVSAEMIYVEADDKSHMRKTFIPTNEDLERLTKLINAVNLHLTRMDLPDITSYEPTLEGIKQFEAFLLGE